MACKRCGEPCQGRLCSFHASEASREGSWEAAFDGDGGDADGE
jgi:hypothetical protein